MSIVYNIVNLTKVYKHSNHKANDALSFSIKEGEIFGLLGPNGAGKSTLVQQITALLQPTSGNIFLYGRNILERPGFIANYVALQPQHPGALKDLTLEEALLLTARLRNVDTAKARHMINDLVDEFEMHTWRKTIIRRLSGGQAQLLNLALAFIGDRPIQIFDEPTNHLDPTNRRRVWQKLLALNRQGITIIIVTHNVLEAEKVFQRVGIINHGRLLALGTPGELKAGIDQSIRLELLLKEDAVGCDGILATFERAQSVTSQQWILFCQREQINSMVDHIISSVGLEHLDDIRIVTPSLEDVYLQLGGKIYA
ncbi:MAG TPA: ABC transporter ATP-binding protein [Ktedonobacteraceae bacterium]|nr:ABC transporter ATP-binding protein [Ktedonobacteraceae bacterium]